MEIVGIIFVFILIVLIGILIYQITKKLKYEQECKEEYIKNKKKEFEEALKEENNVLLSVRKAREKEEQEFQKESEKQKQYLENRKKEVRELVDTQNKLLALKEEDLDKLVQSHYEQEQAEYERTMRAAINLLREDMTAQLTEEIEKGNATLESLKEVIEEYQAKQNAINEQILRQRALDEQQDFYRICIPDEDLEDINYLLSIIDRLRNKEILSKLIWTEYLQKPFKKMMNNVLGNTDPKNVIYKITNLKTQEIYIGKTSGLVSNRWTEHIKTSLNIGTIKRSNIHKALYQHWSDFSWEVLEKVDGEAKLGEREKFYVNFYQSTIYGYNIKSGG